MAAPTDANGTQKYWFDGLPVDNVAPSGVTTGTMQFWFDGQPLITVLATGSSPSSAAVSGFFLFMN